MEIKILGSGCPNCIRLEKTVVEALKGLGKEEKVEKVTDYVDIVSYGVMSTPALVIDGKVIFSGQVPSLQKITEYLK
ncbi:MAG: thioredoxin family protein [Candidatus Aenigmarchaeota archaeon]|nr:thioredoxin family protein [Candidatus Aenigmarchaeota archaeon]